MGGSGAARPTSFGAREAVANAIERRRAQVEAVESSFRVSVLSTIDELRAKPFLAPGHDVVVIDTLRSSTCITLALSVGAKDIVLFGKGRDQLSRMLGAYENYAGPKLLAGELEGRPIEGFSKGNSPLEYTDPDLRGKRVFLSSTNNGAALETLNSIGGFGNVFWASFLNGGAVGQLILDGQIRPPFLLLCAGFRGSLAYEDLLCAGQVLLPALRFSPQLLGRVDDGARLALGLAMRFFGPHGEVADLARLRRQIMATRCATVLAEFGHATDIDAALGGPSLNGRVRLAAAQCLPLLDCDEDPPRIVNRGHLLWETIWQNHARSGPQP